MPETYQRVSTSPSIGGLAKKWQHWRGGGGLEEEGRWWKKDGGGRMGVCQAARLCRKLPTRGVLTSFTTKDEGGGGEGGGRRCC